MKNIPRNHQWSERRTHGATATWVTLALLLGTTATLGLGACDQESSDDLDFDREDGCGVSCGLPDGLCEQTSPIAAPLKPAVQTDFFMPQPLEQVIENPGDFSFSSGKTPSLKFGKPVIPDLGYGIEYYESTEDSGYHKFLIYMVTPSCEVLDEPGVVPVPGEDVSSLSSNVIVAESDQPLWEWNWYKEDYNLTSPGWVWSKTGWISHEYDITQSDTHPEAMAVDGKYYYLIHLDGVTAPDSLVAFISSKAGAFKLKFYATTIFESDPLDAGLPCEG